MSSIKLLRQKFGLRQEEIAQWLGVSRTLVANYDRHERNLHRNASSQLTRMEIVLAHMEKKVGPGNTKNHISSERQDLIREQYERHVKECTYQITRLQRKLEVMQNKHTQAVARLEMMEILMKETTEQKEKMNYTWLQAQYNKTKKLLNTCDEVPQTKLKLRILMMEKAGNISYNEL